MRKEQRPFLKPKTDQTETYQILISSDEKWSARKPGLGP